MTKIEIGFAKFRNHLNAIFPNKKKRLFSSAIITAAGSGRRMGGVSKQLLMIGNKPCVLHSLLAFQNCDEIDEIIIVAKINEIAIMENICRENGISKLKAVVSGGDTRQESVSNGFSAVSKKSDLVAIHDGARPLIQSHHITQLLNEARQYGASCAAKKMSDTVKRVREDGFILDTVPREDLFTVQTPQVFKTDLYRVALALAQKDGISVTDDCALAEHAGFSVKLCDLAMLNLKITTESDVSLANLLIGEKEHA